MSEATGVIELAAMDEAQKAWIAYLKGIGRGEIKTNVFVEIQKAIRQGQLPPDSPGGRLTPEMEQALRGGQTEEFQPEKMTAERVIHNVDWSIAQYARETTTEVPPPPGEVVDLRLTDWAEFGWSKEEKKQVQNNVKMLLGTLGIDARGATRAVEAILLTGKTGREALAILEDLLAKEGEKLQKILQETRGDPLRTLQQIFELPLSSIRAIVPLGGFDSRDTEATPENIEELAWQIMRKGGSALSKWGYDGEFPLMQVRMEYDRQKKRKVGKYYVNEANMVRWLRERVEHWDGESPQDVMDFMQKIELEKEFNRLNLERMFTNEDLFFKSEDEKTNYAGIAEQFRMEGLMATMLRLYQLEYMPNSIIGNEAKLTEKLNQIAEKNHLTKRTFGTNLINFIATMSLQYKEKRANDTSFQKDNIMGSAMINMFLAYYNLADFDKLQNVLGKDSSFFNRDHFMEAMKKVEQKKAKRTLESGLMPVTFLTTQMMSLFEQSFDANGEVPTIDWQHDSKQQIEEKQKKQASFIKFINFFTASTQSGNLEATVREALKSAVGKRYEFTVDKYGYSAEKVKQLFFGELRKDEQAIEAIEEAPDKIKELIKGLSKKYANTPEAQRRQLVNTELKAFFTDQHSLYIAELMMFSLTRITGAAARNDINANGPTAYDAQSKIMNIGPQRRKYATNGTALGNILTARVFEHVLVPLFEGITTEEEVHVLDEQGREVIMDGKPMMRKRTILDIFENLNSIRTLQAQQLQQAKNALETLPEEQAGEREAALQQIQVLERKFSQQYQDIAGKLYFRERSMADYYANHWNRAYEFYKRIMSGKEIELNRFNIYDAFGGVTFDKQYFIKEVQEEYFKQIRYLIESGADINFNEDVRREVTNPVTGEKVFVTAKRGEWMFGYDLLNRKEFWKREAVGVKKKGKIKYKYVYDEEGRHVIDHDLVQKNKRLLYQQVVMAGIAADLFQHQTLNSNDPRFKHFYYTNVVAALASIPGQIYIDEHGKHGVKVTGKFFSKKDLKWLKSRALNGNILFWDLGEFGFNLKWILSDLMAKEDKEGTGFGDAFGNFFKAISPGSQLY